jgi:hypothetical protein
MAANPNEMVLRLREARIRLVEANVRWRSARDEAEKNLRAAEHEFAQALASLERSEAPQPALLRPHCCDEADGTHSTATRRAGEPAGSPQDFGPCSERSKEVPRVWGGAPCVAQRSGAARLESHGRPGSRPV